MTKSNSDIEKIIRICQENDVDMLGIFGSVARGEDSDGSDIDLLIHFSKRKSLLFLVALERKISEAIGKKVDLLTEASISPYLREKILKDLKIIYGTR